MNRNQIENLYMVNGLGDFRLRNLGDLMKCHGINARNIEGYSELSEADKKAYESFIVNFMNMMGMMSRITFYPKKIYRAYNIDFLIKQSDDDCYTIVGGEVWNVSNPNDPVKTRKWTDEDIIYSSDEVVTEKSKEYLRIEYTHRDETEWLHIINNGTEWY